MVTATIVYAGLVLFVHEKEASIFGICSKLFGVKTLAVAPWTYIDPLVIALPLSAIVLVAVSMATQPVHKAVVAD